MHRRKRQMLTGYFVLSVMLFAIWILLSGKFEAKFLLIGLFSALIISAICLPFLVFNNPKDGKEYFLLGINFLKFIPYCLWLLKEIFKASLDVIKEIFKPHMDYEPSVVSFAMPYENPMASVVLAISIILTPGTITIDVMDGGIFEVHALTRGAAEDQYTGGMAQKVAALFNETCQFKPLRELEVTDIPVLSKEEY